MLDAKSLADVMAKNSVVTKVLGRYLYQVLAEIDRTHVKPLEDQNRRYREALEQIASHPVSSGASKRARAALSQNKGEE